MSTNKVNSSDDLDTLIRRLNHPEFPTNCQAITDQVIRNAKDVDQAAANLLHVFSEYQLLSVLPGTDREALRRIPEYTLAQWQEEQIRRQTAARLTVNSIAVRNGPQNLGLYSIHFSSKQQCGLFLRQNPSLSGTLIMTLGDEIVIWLQASGKSFASISLAACRIDSDGTHLLRDKIAGAPENRFIQFSKPLSVELSTIKWLAEDESLILPHRICANYGDFFRNGARGRRLPNSKALAAYFARSYPDFIYSRDDGQFWKRSSGKEQWERVPEAVVREALVGFLRNGAWGKKDGGISCEPMYLDRMLKRLKWEMAASVPMIEERVEEFIVERLERSRGSNMTEQDLYETFERHCSDHHLPLLDFEVFKTLIRRLAAGPPLYLRKSKSIRRGHENPSGFRCVREKLAHKSKAA